jgi:multisubunit Na+/H+ antiporter MnhB subunit
MNNTAVNSIIFFGIEIIGIVAVYLVCRHAWKRSNLVSVLVAVVSSVLFAFLSLFILGTLNRL